jgi:hypothetical protein
MNAADLIVAAATFFAQRSCFRQRREDLAVGCGHAIAYGSTFWEQIIRPHHLM